MSTFNPYIIALERKKKIRSSVQSLTVCFGSWPVHLLLSGAHGRVVLSSINSLMLRNSDDSHDMTGRGKLL